MTQFKSSYLNEAQARGFIHQGTHLETLDTLMAKESVVAYLGFDPTATSLHVGHLTQIMQLRLLQKHGHKPLVLIGDGTARIGDPTFKDTARQLLDVEQINQNVTGIQSAFAKYLRFDDSTDGAVLLRNGDWLLSLNYIDFLRDYGRHFSINRMLTFESVKLRLEREQSLSFLEFNYMILQAYDFLELFQRHQCRLQLGGSDQWGNIVNGVELTRRITGQEVYGLTAPLLMTADGKKMGKTADGAVWLNAEMLPTFDFWQFWRNTNDADVGRCLRVFTELDLAEIARLEKLEGSEINEAKKILANEVTKLCHGDDAVAAANATAEALFTAQGNADSLDNLPSVTVSQAQLQQGLAVVDLFKDLGLAASNGEARRLIRGGGARLNDEPLHDETYLVKPEHVLPEGYIKLSAGKKRHGLVRVP
jgi:tyrosyl-tRNA synthetase (EC 6.1.1.1)